MENKEIKKPTKEECQKAFSEIMQDKEIRDLFVSTFYKENKNKEWKKNYAD